MADETAQILLKRLDSLVVQRQTWESHWQEVADYVVPRKADVTKIDQPVTSAPSWSLTAQPFMPPSFWLQACMAC